VSEHDEQAALIQWRDWLKERCPELAYLFAQPNGGLRPASLDDGGRRYSREAQRLKEEGVEPGVPDLQLPVARHGYHGLWIEMKHGRNSVTPDQQRWIEFLRKQGHRVEVCYGWDAAREVVIDYLGLEDADGN
jgi:hypothetical protein